MGTTEEWKDIKGYEGQYQISNLGNVRSLGINKNCYIYNKTRGYIFVQRIKEMKPTDNGNGYLIVSLKKNGKRKNYYIHRLVAEAFIPNEQGKGYVNHIDYNRMNNNVKNLEWCTQKENIHHSRMNYPKQHNCKTGTGERYITKRANKNLYRVCVKKANVDKCFKELEAAITYRNGVLNEINYTI